jgi:preprotein translocase subunit SecA
MAQKDPLVEYRHEGHLMFEELGQLIRSEVVSLLFHAEVTPGDADALQEEMQGFEEDGDGYAYEHQSLAGSEAIAAAGATATVGAATAGAVAAGTVGGGGSSVATKQRVSSEFDKVGRNDPCPCGSGKKFKKCHGA